MYINDHEKKYCHIWKIVLLAPTTHSEYCCDFFLVYKVYVTHLVGVQNILNPEEHTKMKILVHPLLLETLHSHGG